MLFRPLKREYQKVAKEVFLEQMGAMTRGGTKKKSHDEFSDKVNGLWTNARLFEKGMKLFDGKWNPWPTRSFTVFGYYASLFNEIFLCFSIYLYCVDV